MSFDCNEFPEDGVDTSYSIPLHGRSRGSSLTLAFSAFLESGKIVIEAFGFEWTWKRYFVMHPKELNKHGPFQGAPGTDSMTLAKRKDLIPVQHYSRLFEARRSLCTASMALESYNERDHSPLRFSDGLCLACVAAKSWWSDDANEKWRDQKCIWTLAEEF